MRVLRLELGEGRTVDLHPAVSVVVGLTDAERTTLRRGFTAIGAGLDPGVPGLIEAHGLLLDASQDDLDLLEAGATAAPAVVSTLDVVGVIRPDELEPLRRAERDLLLVAGERWRSRSGPAVSGTNSSVVAARNPERAAELRVRIARHAACDGEGVRVALDALRDATHTGRAPDPDRLAGELAAIGLDTTGLGLPAEDLVRLAEDWLDDRRREADWAVGAAVELAALDTAASRATVGDDRPERLRRETTAGHAEAVTRADQVRARLAAAHAPAPCGADVGVHLADRLAAHRPDRLAGAVPLVLDALLRHLDDGEVARLLDDVAGAAGPVQVVIVDDHPAAQAWAEAAGVRRAAVVAPVPDAVATTSP